MVAPSPIAKHEAAHAFVAWRFGLPINKVTVIGPPIEVGEYGPTSYYCDAGGPANYSGDLTDETLNAALCFFLLPTILDEQVSGDVSFVDAKILLDMLSFGQVKNGGRATLEQARKCRQNPDGAQDFYRLNRAQVAKILEDPRAVRCIDALAARLDTEGRVYGNEIARLFFETWGPDPPKKALKPHHHGVDFERPKTCSGAISTVLKMLSMARDILDTARPETPHEESDLEKLRRELLMIHFNWLEKGSRA